MSGVANRESLSCGKNLPQQFEPYHMHRLGVQQVHKHAPSHCIDDGLSQSRTISRRYGLMASLKINAGMHLNVRAYVGKNGFGSAVIRHELRFRRRPQGCSGGRPVRYRSYQVANPIRRSSMLSHGSPPDTERFAEGKLLSRAFY
jgi:hypothetical protein